MPSKATYYRNRIPINHIEPDALWIVRSEGKVQLVDADQHIEAVLDARFYQVPDPGNLHPDEIE